MRVDASQVLAQGGVKTKQGTDALADPAKQGDVVGLSETDATEEDFSVRNPSLMRGFSDMSLGPYAAKLAELKMTVSEDAARTMRELMAQYPRLSMDEAAFLASNKITGDESLMRAALEVLSGGDKTSAMIAKILSTLGEKNSLVNLDLGTRNPKNSIEGSALPNNFHVSGSGKAPLSELIAAIVKNASSLLETSNQVQPASTPASEQVTQKIITQDELNLQSNVKNIQEILQKPAEEQVLQAFTQGIGGENVEKTPAFAQGIAQNVQIGQNGTATIAQIPLSGEMLAEAGAVPQTEAGVPLSEAQQNLDAALGGTLAGAAQPEEAAVQKQAGAAAGLENVPANLGNESADKQGQPMTLSNAVAQLLSEVPEFKGTPQAALDKFSNMLLRIAKDSGITPEGAVTAKDVEMLTAQLEKMFTKIGRDNSDAGKRLKETGEELFARLTLVQEEIERASQPMRQELLTQTQKLMDHVRLLNNIEQFAYMQLPVQLSEERKTAELYIFKRKGGKRADPDNVNILLSIDLEYMGHWEALLNIKGKDVYLNMEVAGEAEKRHFNENTVLLHELLSEEGFKLVNTNIKISEEETTPLTALSALERYMGGSRGGKIDFKI